MFDLYQPKKSAMVPPSQLAAERRIKPYVCHGVARCVGPQLSWKSTLKSCKSSGDPSKIPQISWFWMNFIYFDVDNTWTAVLERNLLDSACSILFDDGLLRWNWNFQAQIPSVSHWNARACSHEPLSYHLGPKRESTSHNESSWNISICCFIPSQ